MNRRTKFEIMRTRRTRCRKVEALIDEIESDVEREWAKLHRILTEERQQRFDNTADWVTDTRERARVVAKTQPQPSLWRVLLHMLRSLPRTVLSRGA